MFLDNPKYAAQLEKTRATAVLIGEKHAHRTPEGCVPLVVAEPYRACALVSAKIYPEAARPNSLFDGAGIEPGGRVHQTARLEAGVTVDPGAVIGPRAEIGAGTVIHPNAVIGPDVRIGRNCVIGANATVLNALVGDAVIIHPGVRDRPGRVRFRHGAARSSEGAADRPRHHPGRGGDRRQHHDRPRRQPRHA